MISGGPPGGARRLRILFFMRDAALLRVYGEALRLLAGAGHEIHLVHDLDRELDESARLAAECPTITYGSAPAGDPGLWKPFATGLRGLRDYLRYLHPAYAEAPRLRARGRRLAPVPMRILGDLIARGGYRAAERALAAIRAVEEAIPPSRPIRELVRVRRPDAVLVSPLVDFAHVQEPYLKAARSAGVPTAVCVPTWDTLSNKGLIGVVPERVIVWNELQLGEAVSLHGVVPEHVVVTGAQVFERWLGWAPTHSREEFLGPLGLDPRAPLLLYACSSRFIVEDERAAVVRWVEAIRASGDPRLRATSILIRPHPKHLRPWRDASLPFDSVAVWAGETGRFQAGHNEDYFDSIFHSHAVVGVNTSAFIDAAVIGRRVCTWEAPEFEGGQHGTLHFRQLLEAGGGVVEVGRNLPEHVAQLSAALAVPAEVERRRFVETFVRPFGADVPTAPALARAIAEVAQAEVVPLPARRAVLRAAVLPAALLAWPLHHAGAAVERIRKAHRRRGRKRLRRVGRTRAASTPGRASRTAEPGAAGAE